MLSQIEADGLIAMPKEPLIQDISLPQEGKSLRVELVNKKHNEKFFLDIYRQQMVLYATYQTRARKDIVLCRLDLGNKPHTNPSIKEGYQNSNFKLNTLIKSFEGQRVEGPHMHIFVEEYSDKWAFPLKILGQIDETLSQLETLWSMGYNMNRDNNVLFNKLVYSLEYFLDYCNVKPKPTINRRLF